MDKLNGIPYRYPDHRAVAIGNGPCRNTVDLGQIKGDDVITIGCNAIHRDYYPTFITCLDGQAAREIEKKNHVKAFGAVFSQRDRPGFHRIPELTEISTNSGVVSVAIMLAMKVKCLYLIGYDLGGESLYKGTPGYESSATPKQWATWKADLEGILAQTDATIIQVGGPELPHTHWISVETFNRLWNSPKPKNS